MGNVSDETVSGLPVFVPPPGPQRRVTVPPGMFPPVTVRGWEPCDDCAKTGIVTRYNAAAGKWLPRLCECVLGRLA